MGVFTYEQEITSSVPPAKMFKAAVLDADNLIPKVRPQAIKCVEVIQGDGGPGTIKKIHFGEGHKFKSMTHRIDAIDKEKFSLCYTVIEGDVLTDGVESICHELTVVPAPGGGSIYKNTSKYHTKGAEVCEEHVKGGKEDALATFKAIEAYVLAHPDAY
ncbi:major strawberry allergen Fra a 1-2-like [Vitis riparia]|uniref:major strawberry allergen Fra a 1-2-like n=1 Tax=Vitis riparia TaxID=96939 RepID=UPI00155A326A|nr:major strawberry allergen Fra a 1-2-like [Vitis riparia]XP_034686012.1 major strawberry allergen Fra a 1-2-like [Vitis riparia]